jgi:hypothetical protein
MRDDGEEEREGGQSWMEHDTLALPTYTLKPAISLELLKSSEMTVIMYGRLVD